MPRNKSHIQQSDPLPENFHTLEEFWGFWDAHSTAAYEDVMEALVRTNRHATRKSIVLWQKTFSHRCAMRHAARGINETLINLWLQEKARQSCTAMRNHLQASSIVSAVAVPGVSRYETNTTGRCVSEFCSVREFRRAMAGQQRQGKTGL